MIILSALNSNNKTKSLIAVDATSAAIRLTLQGFSS